MAAANEPPRQRTSEDAERLMRLLLLRYSGNGDDPRRDKVRFALAMGLRRALFEAFEVLGSYEVDGADISAGEKGPTDLIRMGEAMLARRIIRVVDEELANLPPRD